MRVEEDAFLVRCLAEFGSTVLFYTTEFNIVLVHVASVSLSSVFE